MHVNELRESVPHSSPQQTSEPFFKDAILDKLAETSNVAQFISFSPGCKQRFSRIHEFGPNQMFSSIENAASVLLESSPERSVNVRSFTPTDPKSREFVYGLTTVTDVAGAVVRLAGDGLYTIVNETVDINDGGVSGVIIGDLIEFAPGDTPRCVEKPGTVSFSRSAGLRFLRLIYGFEPSLKYGRSQRVEFSIHPLRRGVRHEHTIVWEIEDVDPPELNAVTQWPNRFSRFIGDKVFGLLIAHLLDLPVPRTTVLSRSLPPFTFGIPTGTAEPWIRTCPFEQVPGKFTTQRGWRDPYSLMFDEDPEGKLLASILYQEGVDGAYSGALAIASDGSVIVEGVSGSGDEFMLGIRAPERLPDHIIESVNQLFIQARSKLGPVRFEWVNDGQQTWIVQLHRGVTSTVGQTIFPGEAEKYYEFHVADGIQNLRNLISNVEGSKDGIVVIGDVGITSHIGDLLRRAKIPSYLKGNTSF